MNSCLARLPALLASTTLLVACPSDPVTPLPVVPDVSIDLAEALGVIDAEVVGVTVDPLTGQRYVLDQFEGIFELAADGSAILLSSIEDLPVPAILPRSLWTDFVAMGEGRFALTALSDGYLLDLAQDTMVEYFCYEPGDMLWEQQQLTHSVTFDPQRGVLYAQPITFEEGGFESPVALFSSIGEYSLEGGQPSSWFDLDDTTFLAGGAAVDGDGTLLLGRGVEVYRFDPWSGQQPELVGQLPARTGSASQLLAAPRIEAMAVDVSNGELLVVDASVDQLLTMRLADL